MNEKLKSELKEVYAELIRYLDNGGSKVDRDIILDKLCDVYDRLQKIGGNLI